MARRDVDRIVIEMKGIADDLGGRLGVPRHHPDGVGIGLHVDIDGAVAHRGGLPDIAAVDREREDFFRDAQATRAVAFQELRGRQDFAARRARHIGDEAFDLRNAPGRDPFFELLAST